MSDSLRAARIAICLLVFVAPPALAQTEKIALFPLVLVGEDSPTIEQHAELLDASRARFATVNVEGPLRSTTDGPCALDDACLAGIAIANQARATLVVTASLYSPKVVVTARMVSTDGAAPFAPISREFSRDVPLREVFGAVLDDARTSLAAVRAPVPVSATPIDTPRSPWNWKHYTGLGLGVAGLGVAGVGLGSHSSANALWSEHNAAFANGILPASSEAGRLRDLSSRARGQQQTGTIALVTGGALIGAGAFLLFTAGSEPEVTVAPSGSGVVVSGRFE